MLDKAKQFVEANPQLVTNTLLAGGLGAVGGALLPTPKEDEDELASDRVKRRLKNALIGAAVVGGTGALLSNAAYNFGTAKLQRQLTPEEKSKLLLDKTHDTTHAVLTSPYTLGTAAVGGGLYGQFGGKHSDYFARKEKANAYIKGIREIRQKNKLKGKAQQQLNLDLPAENSGARGLRQWLSKNNDMSDAAKKLRADLLRDAAGHITPGEAAKLIREYGVHPLDAGLDTAKLSRLANFKAGIKPWLRSNKFTALGAVLAPAILGGVGYAMGTSDGGKLTPQD